MSPSRWPPARSTPSGRPAGGAYSATGPPENCRLHPYTRTHARSARACAPRRYVAPDGTPHPVHLVVNTLVTAADRKVLQSLARKVAAGSVFGPQFGLLHQEGEGVGGPGRPQPQLALARAHLQS